MSQELKNLFLSESNAIGLVQLSAIQDWTKTFLGDSTKDISDVCRTIVYKYVNKPYWCYNCFQSSKVKYLYYCMGCNHAKYCSFKCYQLHQPYHNRFCLNNKMDDNDEKEQKCDMNQSLETLQSIKNLRKLIGSLKRRNADQSIALNLNCMRNYLLLKNRNNGNGESTSDNQFGEALCLFQLTNAISNNSISNCNNNNNNNNIRTKDEAIELIRLLWSICGMPELVLHENLQCNLLCHANERNDKDKYHSDIAIWIECYIYLLHYTITYNFKDSQANRPLLNQTIIKPTKINLIKLPMLKLVYGKLLNLSCNSCVMGNYLDASQIICSDLIKYFKYKAKNKHFNDDDETINYYIQRGMLDGILNSLYHHSRSGDCISEPQSRLFVNMTFQILNLLKINLSTFQNDDSRQDLDDEMATTVTNENINPNTMNNNNTESDNASIATFMPFDNVTDKYILFHRLFKLSQILLAWSTHSDTTRNQLNSYVNELDTWMSETLEIDMKSLSKFKKSQVIELYNQKLVSFLRALIEKDNIACNNDDTGMNGNCSCIKLFAQDKRKYQKIVDMLQRDMTKYSTKYKNETTVNISSYLFQVCNIDK